MLLSFSDIPLLCGLNKTAKHDFSGAPALARDHKEWKKGRDMVHGMNGGMAAAAGITAGADMRSKVIGGLAAATAATGASILAHHVVMGGYKRRVQRISNGKLRASPHVRDEADRWLAKNASRDEIPDATKYPLLAADHKSYGKQKRMLSAVAAGGMGAFALKATGAGAKMHMGKRLAIAGGVAAVMGLGTHATVSKGIPFSERLRSRAQMSTSPLKMHQTATNAEAARYERDHNS